jgi:hypothetical protein
MKSTKCSALLITIAVLCSCSATGGGGGAGTTITLYSEPALDGCFVWEGSTNYSGSYNSGASVSIGDDASDGVVRCLVSFDVSSVPAGAQIDTATLRMYQNATVSGDSYGDLGGVFVTNVSYTLATPWEDLYLDSTTGRDIDIGPIATSFSPSTWHEIDVTDSAAGEFEVLHNGRLQFRLYHDIENDHDPTADSDGWNMGESPTNRPELVIKLK